MGLGADLGNGRHTHHTPNGFENPSGLAKLGRSRRSALAEQSVPNRDIIRQHLKPNWVTYVTILVVAGLTFLYLISMAAEAATPEVIGIFCAGPIFALPLLALALKGPSAGKVYFLGFTAVTLAFVGLVTAVITTLRSPDGAEAGVGLFFFLTVPLSLIMLIPLFFFLRQTAVSIRDALHLNLLRRTAELIEEKGKLTFSEMGVALETSPEQIDNLVDEVKARELTAVHMVAHHQRVYTPAALKKEQQTVLDTIQQRGQVYLDDVALMMRTPVPLITEWIYHLVHLNQFSGFINWETAVLYSSSASQLRAGKRCPVCDGQLGMEGERIRCQHCNSEILLGEAA